MKSFDEISAYRRSIRKFDANRPLDAAQLQQIVSAAIEAPTWKNSQTGRYYIAATAEAIAQVRACLPEFNQASCNGAQALIVSTFKHNRSGYERNGEPTNELGNGWGCYDLGLQNAWLLLKAADLGADSLVMGIRDAEALRKVFDIPTDETVVAVIAIGYRTETPQRPKRKELTEYAKFI